MCGGQLGALDGDFYRLSNVIEQSKPMSIKHGLRSKYMRERIDFEDKSAEVESVSQRKIFNHGDIMSSPVYSFIVGCPSLLIHDSRVCRFLRVLPAPKDEAMKNH